MRTTPLFQGTTAAKIRSSLLESAIGTPLYAWIKTRGDVTNAVTAAMRRHSGYLPAPVADALTGLSGLDIPGFSETSFQPTDRTKTASRLIDDALGVGMSDYLRPFAEQYVAVMVTPEWIEEQRKNYLEAGYPPEQLYGPEFDAQVERYRISSLESGYGFIAAILRKEPMVIQNILSKHNKRWSKLAATWLGSNLSEVKAQANRDAEDVRKRRQAEQDKRDAQRKRDTAVQNARGVIWTIDGQKYNGNEILQLIVDQGNPVYRTKGGTIDYYSRVHLGDYDYFLGLDKTLGAAFRVLYPGHPTTQIGNSRYASMPPGRYKKGDEVELQNYRYLPVTGFREARAEYDKGRVVVLETNFSRQEYDAIERARHYIDRTSLAKVAPVLGSSR